MDLAVPPRFVSRLCELPVRKPRPEPAGDGLRVFGAVVVAKRVVGQSDVSGSIQPSPSFWFRNASIPFSRSPPTARIFCSRLATATSVKTVRRSSVSSSRSTRQKPIWLTPSRRKASRAVLDAIAAARVPWVTEDRSRTRGASRHGWGRTLTAPWRTAARFHTGPTARIIAPAGHKARADPSSSGRRTNRGRAHLRRARLSAPPSRVEGGHIVAHMRGASIERER